VTYNVFGGTLSLTQSSSISQIIIIIILILFLFLFLLLFHLKCREQKTPLRALHNEKIHQCHAVRHYTVTAAFSISENDTKQ